MLLSMYPPMFPLPDRTIRIKEFNNYSMLNKWVRNRIIYWWPCRRHRIVVFTGLFKNRYSVSIIYVLSPALSAGVPCASTKPPDLGHKRVFWEESTSWCGRKCVSTTSLLSFKEGCTRWLLVEPWGAIGRIPILDTHRPVPRLLCIAPQRGSPKTKDGHHELPENVSSTKALVSILNIIPFSLFLF